MDAATKSAVLNALGATSPEDAATWMDDMRSNPAYDYMKPWHYVDFEKGTSYPARTEENAVTEMTAAWLELKHRQTLTPEEVKVAVMILFHLTGDLHMPLHAGYAEDKGGNTVQVQFNGTGSNLHRVWDDDIVQQQHITLASVEGLYTSLSEAGRRQINLDMVGWMNESRAYLPQVYGFTGNNLDDAYAIAAKPIIQQQLLNAGLRLAALMESIFTNNMQQTISSPAAGNAKGSQAPAQVSTALPKGAISPGDAAHHIGEQVTVCGHVYGGKFQDKGSNGPTFINMGAAYPNSPFTVVIFKNDRANFSYAPETFLDGKDICVTGKVKEYKGKAEIIADSEKQIDIR